MVVILEVIKGSLAERSELKAGDQIETINDTAPVSADHAASLIQESDRSASLKLRYYRDKELFDIAISFQKTETHLGIVLVEAIKIDRVFRDFTEKIKPFVSSLFLRSQKKPRGLVVGIPQMNIFLVLILYGITFTLYEPIWYLRRMKVINSLHSRIKLDILLPVLVLVITSVQIAYGTINFNIGAKLSWLLSICFNIVIAFHVKNILVEHLKSKVVISSGFSGILTFFFRFFYLQYKINRQGEKVLC